MKECFFIAVRYSLTHIEKGPTADDWTPVRDEYRRGFHTPTPRCLIVCRTTLVDILSDSFG